MADIEIAPPCANCGTNHDDPVIMLDCSRMLASVKDKAFIDKISQMPLADRVELLTHMLVNLEIHLAEFMTTLSDTYAR